MSFEFKWPKFSPSFYDHAKDLLSTALNKGDKPAIIADRIEVNQLDMGTIPPDLEILEIGDLGRDRFRGIFRMTYAGDASIRLQTKVQVNPLRQRTPTATSDVLTTPPILFASTPLIVPMTLSLSSLKLRAIVVLVISRLEGVTLVFKNDPLESVQVSSTFDSLAAIQTFLQSEIERQLRDLFRSELPSIIHQLSRRWLGRDNPDGRSQTRVELPSTSAPSTPTPSLPTTQSNGDPNGLLSVPDEIEGYDPTYGLRPSHPPLVGCFTNYRSLIKQKNRKLGLGAVLSQTDDEEEHSKEDLTPSDVSSSTLYSPPHSPTPSPQQKQKKPAASRAKKPMIKPKIFHSHSAGIVNSALSSSGISSHNGHEGTRSSSKALEPKARMKLEDLQEARVEGEQLEEGEVLRSRRLERLSMQSHSVSSSGLATRMMSIREKAQRKRPEQIRMSTSPISTFRTQPLPRPTPSIFPSTQRSSMTCLPAYASNCGTPVRSHAHSPLFLGSRSTSPMRGEDEKNDQEGGEESEGEGSQCALLASLVRSNCTLSPFSRSISHFAARSTPLRHSSPSSALSSPTRVSHLNELHSFYSRDTVDLDQLHLRSSWNDLHADGFKQKRNINQIGPY
ncbi:ERMES complex subunit [Puccinia graminis f. sp. tritici]|uniref:Mitochondrial distribution and morphology protein 34 n=1 Tax=Puccinia graminis f. sp. tritici TaxID=56615 RepID=A0A5B0RMR3_PUCGR|nr:ERMES complex subunit [Puccinia graminis f. sp. tritici]